MEGWIGVSETLLVTCVCGVVMALLSGQPLTVVGATGPIVVFEEGLYQVYTECSIIILKLECFKILKL